MRARGFAVACSVLLSTACGSSSSTAAPPPQSPSPEPSGNPTTSQPSPTPSPSPSPTPSPSPSPGPSPAPSPQPDRFVDVTRLDQDPECDALVPASVPAPVAETASDPGPGGCGRGVSDGTGHVAAVFQQSSRGAQWQVFGPDGAPAQKLAITSDLWPQPDGWLGLQASTSGVPASATLLSFFPDGAPRRSETPQPGAFGARVVNAAPDPRGGAAVLLWGPTPGGGCQGELRRFDGTGAPTGNPGQTGCDVSGLGLSTTGDALVLEGSSGGGVTVRWIRPDGTAAAPPTRDVGPGGGELLPLLDGSLVLRQGAAFTRRYAHLAPGGDAAPAWLAARANQTFRFTRGNKGYALFPPAGQNSADCTQAVELLAPSGRRCVKLTFRRDGNACVTGAIDQGWDGTIVQQASSGACGWRSWPRLLAGDRS